MIYEEDGLVSNLNEEGIVTTTRSEDELKVDCPVNEFCSQYEKGNLGEFINGELEKAEKEKGGGESKEEGKNKK